ncbi:MAG: ATP-binding cassette domain-containing protein [Gemmatimonadota bacterium]
MTGPSGAATAVELLGLGRRFGELTAVDGLTFAVGHGELFGIVGPDGAGKTTTLRMLAGVLRPSTGDARVRGISVARDPEGVKPVIAYMSQRFGLYEDLTVRENIDFYADLYRVPRAVRPSRRERLWAFSGLGPFESRLAGALSGGMKQKLGLCCALVHQPQVLLLDEPTFGVDPISRRDLWLIVHEMVAGGTTAIVTTAYMDEAERCDRVALLHRGRLVGLDAPVRLQEALRGSILGVSADRPRAAVDALRRAPGVRGAALFGDRIHVSVAGGSGAWPEIRAAAQTGGVRLGDMRVIEPSLEDVFIHLVSEEGPA